MRERPILFSAPMVRAILEGRKTQTRRIVKPQPPSGWNFHGYQIDSTAGSKNNGCAMWAKEPSESCLTTGRHFARPRWSVGDVLWVRESFSFHEAPSEPYFLPPGTPGEALGVHYWADGNPEWGDWEKPKPSIHMPRRVARILLEVVSLRLERLQAITMDDARAEGVETEEFLDNLDWCHSVAPRDISCEFPTVRSEFEGLWRRINGYDSWDENPWVWVVGFRRIEATP